MYLPAAEQTHDDTRLGSHDNTGPALPSWSPTMSAHGQEATSHEANTTKTPASETVLSTSELLQMILAHLPREEIDASAAVCKRFKRSAVTSPMVRAAAFGAGLSKLLSLHFRLESSAPGGVELLIIKDITSLGPVNRNNGTRKIGISLITCLTSNWSAPTESSKTGYIIALAKQQLSQHVPSEEAQDGICKEIDAAFPSSPIPLELELGIVTHRQVKDVDGALCQVVYRVNVCLHSATLASLSRVQKAIKKAVGMPHRRGVEKLDVRWSEITATGLLPQDFARLVDAPKYTQEYWKI